MSRWPWRGAAGIAASALRASLLCWLGGGCALLSRGKTLDVRWYTPETVSADRGSAEVQGRGCALRFGSVTSAAQLGPRIVFGDGLHRVDRYEALRWTERPERYVQRAIARALFEEGACFQRSISDMAPVLEVELLDFEEVKTPTEHAARVAVRALVGVSDRTVVERTLVVSDPVRGEGFDAFVGAMARALEKTASDVSSVAEAGAGCPPPAQ